MSRRTTQHSLASDEKIIDMYWQRDPDAIQETDHKYGNLLRNVAYNILFDSLDCEECQNDTYLRIWNSIPSDRPAAFSAFVPKQPPQVLGVAAIHVINVGKGLQILCRDQPGVMRGKRHAVFLQLPAGRWIHGISQLLPACSHRGDLEFTAPPGFRHHVL